MQLPSPNKSDLIDARVTWCLLSIQCLQNGGRHRWTHHEYRSFRSRHCQAFLLHESVRAAPYSLVSFQRHPESKAFGSLFLRCLPITCAFEQCHFLLKPLLLFSICTFIWRSPLRLHHPRILLWKHLPRPHHPRFPLLKTSHNSFLRLQNLKAIALRIKSISQSNFGCIIIALYLKASSSPIRTTPSSLSLESIW